MKSPERQSGFTLVESAISLVILSLLLTGVFSITIETTSFLGDNEVDVVVQAEAHRTLERMTDLLRKTGRIELAGIQYPLVTDGGAALHFLMLADLDGNGFPFDATTSALEWGPTVYSIRLDAAGNVDVYRGADKVQFLGRFVDFLRFQTVEEDSALQIKEIQMAYDVRRTTKDGVSLVYPVRGSVHMRN